jgi:hypothetical protein
MYRCATRRHLLAASAALAFFAAALPAAAQVQRQFPQNALRGIMVFDNPPQVTLNGKPAQLAPGVRIRGQNNLLVMTGPLIGRKLVVHYTVETIGLVKDVWILRDEEIKVVPWPTTPEQLQTWTFDPAAQVWTKP